MGMSLYCAKSFAEGEPFLFCTWSAITCPFPSSRGAAPADACEVARPEQCSVSGVQPTRESMLPYYGTVGGLRVPKHEEFCTRWST